MTNEKYGIIEIVRKDGSSFLPYMVDDSGLWLHHESPSELRGVNHFPIKEGTKEAGLIKTLKELVEKEKDVERDKRNTRLELRYFVNDQKRDTPHCG